MSVIYLSTIYVSKNTNIVPKSLIFIPFVVHQYGKEVKFSNPLPTSQVYDYHERSYFISTHVA